MAKEAIKRVKAKHVEKLQSLGTFFKIRGGATFALSLTGAAVFVLAGVWALQIVMANRAVYRAQQDLRKGFAALAVDRLEPYRRGLASTEKGCKVLVNAYFEAKEAARLAWASQACLDAGLEIPESYLGLSAAKELGGAEAEALDILVEASNRFLTSPDFHFRMARILKRANNVQGATASYLEATRRAPDHTALTLEAMQYFSQIRDWANARSLAEKLKDVPSHDADVKFSVARALRFGRAPVEATRTAIEEGTALLEQAPEAVQERLRTTYADVLNAYRRMPASAGKAHGYRRFRGRRYRRPRAPVAQPAESAPADAPADDGAAH